MMSWYKLVPVLLWIIFRLAPVRSLGVRELRGNYSTAASTASVTWQSVITTTTPQSHSSTREMIPIPGTALISDTEKPSNQMTSTQGTTTIPTPMFPGSNSISSSTSSHSSINGLEFTTEHLTSTSLYTKGNSFTDGLSPATSSITEPTPTPGTNATTEPTFTQVTTSTPGTNSTTEPTSTPGTNSTTEPTTTPGTNPITEQTTTPGTNSTTTPTSTPGTNSTTEQTTTPGINSTTEPTTTPGTNPTTEQTTTPGTNSTTKPTSTPGTNSTTEQTTTPGINSTTEPTTTPGTNPITEPTSTLGTNSTTETLSTTNLPISTTANSTNSSILIMDNNNNNRNKVPIMTTSMTTSTSKKDMGPPGGGLPCSPTHRNGLVSKCLIAIASLAVVATFFMVGFIIICTKYSSRKHCYRVRLDHQGTEMMCISALLPDGNGPLVRPQIPKCNGALLHGAELDSDEEGGDNLTLHSFLPDNDHSVESKYRDNDRCV